MFTNLAMKLWGTPLSPTSKTRPQDTETAEVLEEQPLPDAEEMGQKPLGLPGLVNVYSLRTGKSPSEKLAKAIQRTQWLSFSSSRLPVIVYQVFSLSNWDNPQISDSGETDWMGVEGSWQHGRTCSWVWRTWKTHWPKMARSWWRSSRRTRMRLRHLRPLRHFKPLRQGSKVLKQ